jgi:hypothetical protein
MPAPPRAWSPTATKGRPVARRCEPNVRSREGEGDEVDAPSGALVAALALSAAPAPAAELPNHQLLGAISGERIGENQQFKDACGVAVDSHGNVYVADYYGDRVAIFNSKWEYLTRVDGVDPDDAGGVRPLNGPCDLAVDPAGRLYVASYHGALRRYTPGVYPPVKGTSYGSAEAIDPGPVTGIAVDPATGDLYADRRTSVARYEAPVSPGEGPVQLIGAGNLEDGYGVGLSDFEGDSEYGSTKGYVYVADAGAGTVKAYDPAASLTDPVQTIRGEGTTEGGFQLEDADLEVDSADGHLYLSDNLQPSFEDSPELVVDEFSSAGFYRGSVPPNFASGFASFLHAGEPSGLAIAGGNLYVTSGNWEKAVVYVFGPPAPAEARTLEVKKAGNGQGAVTSLPAGIACGPVCNGEFDAGSTIVLRASAAAGSAFEGWSGCDSEPSAGRCAVTVAGDREVTADFAPAPSAGSAAAQSGVEGGSATAASIAAPPSSRGERGSSRHGSEATLVRRGNLQVALRGQISPKALPRKGTAPVAVSVGGQISTTDGSALPQLKRLAIELNRGGHLDAQGLPTCPLARIRIASSDRALSACRSALVGSGIFKADVVLHGQAPYPSTGRLLAFNAREHGQPVLYAHIYSAKPFATSFVIRFKISHPAHGRFGTALTASLPEALSSWGYVSAIRLRLFRRYAFAGRAHSYISAGCPAPRGFSVAPFTLARTAFSFSDGKKLSAKLSQSCRVR